MKRQFVYGEGIQGMDLHLSLCDMLAANQMANTLKKVIESRKERESYDKCPYDKRKELYPNGCPKQIELEPEAIEALCTLMQKMSYSATTTLFDEEDEIPAMVNDKAFNDAELG